MKDILFNNRNFFLGILLSAIAAFLLSFISVWQLIIIAGFLAGLLNRTIKKGTLSGAFGVGIFWLIYMVIGMVVINAYTILDQFGGLLIGEGFGWLIFLVILFVGILLGALGGAIGSGIIISIKGYETSGTSKDLKE